jgi:acetylornithine deacetylase/succinyl-diaminopimelate desuccinylase-like protein
VIRRLDEFQPAAVVSDTWRKYVEGMEFDEETGRALLDSAAIMTALERLSPFMAQRAHAFTHTTIAPTLIEGGTKINVIPDRVTIDIDVRTLPGQSAADVVVMLRETFADLTESVDIGVHRQTAGSISAIDTPLWTALTTVAAELCDGAVCIPSLSTGTTDARFYRELGIPAYGFGLYSRQISVDEFGAMFHGINERIDQDSLELSTAMWERVARAILE